MMKTLREIIYRYRQAERDRTFPFSEWQRKDIFERLVKDFLIILGYNPDQINYDDVRGVVEEVKGKYVVEWHPAGEGKIKDGLAVEFLAKMLEKEKRFSKARSKTIWQKIAEVKVPEFTSEVKEGFLKYKSAMEKAKKLDEKITRIDRAIDRLVYDLYGFTEDEIKVVEKSVWGDKFEEMYSKLPSRESTLKVSEVYKNG